MATGEGQGIGVAELVWKGKTRDSVSDTSRAEVRRETVELVGPAGNAATCPSDSGSGDGWRNLLLAGDNRLALPSLLPEYAGAVKLVYIDPPFATGNDFTFRATIPVPRGNGARRVGRATARIDRPAYRDPAPRELDGYLQALYETALVLRDLLADDGSIYVHCDWRLSGVLRLMLDEVFGAENFRNEIVWAYRSGGASRRESLARKHDVILLYAKSPRFRVRPQIERQYLKKPFMGSQQDAEGRYYVDTILRDVLEGELLLVRDDGLVRYNLRPVLNLSGERLDYPTQKPLGLLRLLLEIASAPGDLVLDCFCGSGTTAAAAEALGRRWIACDAHNLAIRTTRKRLLMLETRAPFAVQRVTPPENEPTPRDETITGGRPDITICAAGGDGTVAVTLAGFVMPEGTHVPEHVYAAVTSWSQWVDVWAVDWDYDGRVFRAGAWAVRARKTAALPLTLRHRYVRPGVYVVAVRVTDVLGGETTSVLRVTVGERDSMESSGCEHEEGSR